MQVVHLLRVCGLCSINSTPVNPSTKRRRCGRRQGWWKKRYSSTSAGTTGSRLRSIRQGTNGAKDNEKSFFEGSVRAMFLCFPSPSDNYYVLQARPINQNWRGCPRTAVSRKDPVLLLVIFRRAGRNQQGIRRSSLHTDQMMILIMLLPIYLSLPLLLLLRGL